MWKWSRGSRSTKVGSNGEKKREKLRPFCSPHSPFAIIEAPFLFQKGSSLYLLEPGVAEFSKRWVQEEPVASSF